MSIQGSIRINPKNYTDAFVSNPDGGSDIRIDGVKARNSAMEGDIVRIKLNQPNEWQLNYTVIAARWDDWSVHLSPIIQSIQKSKSENSSQESSSSSETQDGANQELLEQASDNHTLASKKHHENRIKRSVHEQPVAKKNKLILPSNIPKSILDLKVTHLLPLPFSHQCIQKTGTVTEIIKKNHSGYAGGMLKSYSHRFALFAPLDYRIPRMLIEINECPLDFATEPDRYKDILFVGRILDWNCEHNYAIGTLVRIVGDCNKIQSRIEAMLMEHQVYDMEFPKEVYNELEYLNSLPDDWLKKQADGRRDLTSECVFTIDPKTARDLDDALSIKQISEQIYEVGVHIADVSYFVKEMTAVDYHARLRTTSVYLVERVIPMLPRILCEQMCSLNPGQNKLTFSVIWKMDEYGRIIDEWFGRTIIRSCVKLAYEQAQDIIDRPSDVSWMKHGQNMPELFGFDWGRISKSVGLLNKIAKNMRVKRFEDGALRINQVKINYELDTESGFPTGLSFESRSDANFLIEEYMLLANMAVAKKIYDYSNKIAFLRRHPPSPPNLLKDVKDFCEAKGFPLDITSSGSIQKSLNSISDQTTSKVVSFLLLKAMKNAEYVCLGSLSVNDNQFRHFALNVPFYTHFTSPIRRYADVVVHRQLSLALTYESQSNEDMESLAQVADECTKRKISSKLISDTSQKLYFNLFVQKAGYCELLGCVTKIYDQSFDVILVDYDRIGRVYINRVQNHLEDFKFESHSGIKRLVLNWKLTANGSHKKSVKNPRKFLKKYTGSDVLSRASLENSRFSGTDEGLIVNQTNHGQQIIEVFDVIKVVVTVDEKDITKLLIDLKVPGQ